MLFKEKKTILMLLDKEFPPDVRVRREAIALIEAGYRVILLCRNLQKQKTSEVIDGIHIQRLPAFHIASTAIRKIISKPVFFNPAYIIKAMGIIRTNSICGIHVHDLPLAPLAIILSQILQVPAIVDFHEDYPAMIRSEKRQGLQGLLFNNLHLLEYIEKWVLAHSKNVISVSHENTARIESMGLSDLKCITLMNVVDLDEFILPREIYADDPPPYKILYTGIIGPARGLELIIHSLSKLTEKHKNSIILHIVGDGKARIKLEQQCHKYNLERQIQFLGMVPRDHLSSFVLQSHICIIPHEPNDHTNSTIPNKIFEFMAAKKPVIVSNTIPMQKIVNATQCGVVFDYQKPDSFNEALVSLIESKDLRNKLGENGFRNVQETYNWNHEKRKLIHLYDQIIKESLNNSEILRYTDVSPKINHTK